MMTSNTEASPDAMPSWLISGCTTHDAAALAYNNISAFWTDPTWRLLWPETITLEYLIEQSSKRQARNLIRDREATRHLRATDPVTGALVGYARFVLPETCYLDDDATPPWPEAQVPDVSPSEKQVFDKHAQSAWWEGRKEISSIDDKNDDVLQRLLRQKSYISQCDCA